MLKGWFDGVLVYGGVYTSTIRYDRGHFAGRRAMLSVSTGGPAPTLAYNGRNGDIDLQLWPANMSLAYVGYTVLPHYVAAGVEGAIKYSDVDAHAHRIAGYKDELRQRLLALDSTEPLRFNGWDKFDEEGRLKPGVAGHSYFMRAEP